MQSDEAHAVSAKFSVHALPTFVVLKDGKVSGSVTGADFATVARLCEEAGQKLERTCDGAMSSQDRWISQRLHVLVCVHVQWGMWM